MNPLTIIFVQKEIGNGSVAQLECALEAAALHSPNCRRVVITDDPGRYWGLAEVYCIDEYWDLADRYAPLFKHTSQLSPWFEVMAIQRWLVIAQWIKKHGGTHFFCADSDVMIFSDLEREREKFAAYDYTLSTDGMIPGFRQAGSIFASAEVLTAFAAYLFARDGHGGSDMTLWSDFSNDGAISAENVAGERFRRGETTDIMERCGEKSTGDHHLQYEFWQYESDGILKPNGFESKKLTWMCGEPWGKTKAGELVRFLWLHCWGHHKRKMDFHLECSRKTLDASSTEYFPCPL